MLHIETACSRCVASTIRAIDSRSWPRSFRPAWRRAQRTEKTHISHHSNCHFRRKRSAISITSDPRRLDFAQSAGALRKDMRPAPFAHVNKRVSQLGAHTFTPGSEVQRISSRVVEIAQAGSDDWNDWDHGVASFPAVKVNACHFEDLPVA